MEILEPIEQSKIPTAIGGARSSPDHELFDRVLELNGKALPVKFADEDAADKQAHTWRVRSSACSARGIRIQKRGKIIYLSTGV